jgi:D-beta-D-heptose 7-phosphate kinase/D-beta-D-heptose 1-phosphate adenosyltransferase
MITQQLRRLKILLVGDDCLDVYQYGTVERISPEAPVPILKRSHTEKLPGMAGNVYENLTKLGCNVFYVHNETSTKTRIIDIKSKQHIVRIDEDFKCTPLTFNDVNTYNIDAIVVSDYDKGTITYDFVKELRKRFDGPIFVDTKKKDLKEFEGCIVKINSKEYREAKTLCSNLIITLGEKGAIYKGKNYPAHLVRVADVCGAGDTFLSSLVYKYLLTKNMDDSIEFSLKASAITVQHTGVYAPSMEEINAT